MGNQSGHKSVMEQRLIEIVAVQKSQQIRQELLLDGIVPTAPVVMLAGSFGSGVGELAEKLALRMRVPFYGPRRLGSLAIGLGEDDEAWPDEELEGDFLDSWLGYMHQSANITAHERLIQLSGTIREIAKNGGVVAGVCSHMVASGDKLLRVKVEAGTQFCARRLAEIRGIDEAEAKRIFLNLEAERRQFLQASFDVSFIDAIEYDLVLHAEKSTMEEMLYACLGAIDRKGMISKGKRSWSSVRM